MYTTTDAPEEDVIEAGQDTARKRKKERLYGWHWVCDEIFDDLPPLALKIDGNPSFGKCQHANVTGWPAKKNQSLDLIHELIGKLPKGLFKLPEPIVSGYRRA